jgi:hypothetical protein
MMSLKKTLYNFCKVNNIEDLSCILHITLLNCIANLSKKQKFVNISPKVIDSFSGIGEELAFNLLSELSNKSTLIKKYYIFKCTEDKHETSGSINDEEIDDYQDIKIEACYRCNHEHKYNIDIDDTYEIGFSANREKTIEELKLTNNDIIKEMVVINTNPEHIDKIANILISKLKLQPEKKEEVKTGMIKYLHSIKNFSGLIADITGDAATTTGNIKQIAEDLSGFSSIKEIFNSET